MAKYLTYDKYGEMGGTLDETTFEALEYEAECYINWYTFDRLKNETSFQEEVVRCMYALVDYIMKMRQAMSSPSDNDSSSANGGIEAGIARQENDGVLVSYNVVPAHTLYDMTKKEVGNTISLYLSGVRNSLGKRLLYRGLYEDE